MSAAITASTNIDEHVPNQYRCKSHNGLCGSDLLSGTRKDLELEGPTGDAKKKVVVSTELEPEANAFEEVTQGIEYRVHWPSAVVTCGIAN